MTCTHTLTRSLEGYRRRFSLDEDSLVRLAEQMGRPVHKILEALQGPKTKTTEALVAELLGQASGDASAFSQEPLNVPILGSLAACGLSFAPVYRCSAPPWMWTPRACWLRPPSTTPNTSSQINPVKDPSPEPGPAGGGSEGLGARRLHLCPG